jgi:hypothetical protein
MGIEDTAIAETDWQGEVFVFLSVSVGTVRGLEDLVDVVGMGGLRDADVVEIGGFREDGNLERLGVAVGVVLFLLGTDLTDVVAVDFGLVSVVPVERASDAAVGAYSLDWVELGVLALGGVATGLEVL